MADNAEGGSEAQITFKVKAPGEKTHSITMADSVTVLELKTKLATEEFTNIPKEQQRLIYSGRVMKNEDTLASYKVKPGNTIHLVKNAASNPTPAPSAAASQPVPQAIPNNMAAGTSADNPLAGLTSARFAGYANLPSANMFGADGGMGAPQSEEQVAEMLENPATAQMFREALNNPSVIDMFLQMNPMYRDNPQAREHARQMLQNPQVRAMISNPDTIRATAQIRRAMAGGAGGSAFPAPGATDNTPAGAPAAGGQAGNNAPNPWAAAGLFGMPGVGAGAGTGAGAGAGAANPFMALLNPFGAPPAAQPTGASPASGDNATQRDASATTGSTPAGQAGANNAPGANPFAGLFASPPPGSANPFGMPPELMQQFMQMMGGAGGAGGAGEPAAPADNRPPEDRYAEQLRQLNEMGFYDFDQNVAALRRSGGNVQGAVNFLLGG